MKIAIVGLGNAAANLHLPALAGIDTAQITGGMDSDERRRTEAARRFGIETFAEFDEMMDRSGAEVAIVATPPDTHADYARRILDRGCHLISEKPFTSTLAEADELLALAGDRLHIAVNHEFRTMPIFRRVRDAVGSANEGLRFLQVWQLMNLPPWREDGWRSHMPGRSFYEGGIHLVDYAMFVYGEKPLAVSATVSGGGERDATDAVTVATLEFSRGRLAQVVQDRICPGDTQYFEVRADCQEASYRASFGGRARLSVGLHRSTTPHVRLEMGRTGLAWSETGHRRRVLERNPANAPMVATRLLLQRTLAAFEQGTEPPAPGQAGRDVLEVLAACYLSAQSGRRVALDRDATPRLQSMNLGTVSEGLPETT